MRFRLERVRAGGHVEDLVLALLVRDRAERRADELDVHRLQRLLLGVPDRPRQLTGRAGDHGMCRATDRERRHEGDARDPALIFTRHHSGKCIPGRTTA